jgi:hypothetical protein
MSVLETGNQISRLDAWPSLSLPGWSDTCDTLHMWTQMVGKVRMALAPHLNHWWEVTLYVTDRGLTTTPIPYGRRTFEINFDFIDHQLVVLTADGAARTVALAPRPVADFYREFMAALHSLGIGVKIWPMPVEVPDPIRFDQDRQHSAYDPEFAQRFWRVLLQTQRIFTQFRAGFIGKSSPVQFFWGSFDLSVTLFSGRPAPQVDTYPWLPEDTSHEHYALGFWPGSGPVQSPAFYAYIYPAQPGLQQAVFRPQAAHWNAELGEAILLYEDVRGAGQPEEDLLAFCQSTYAAATSLANWDRAALERHAGKSSKREGI